MAKQKKSNIVQPDDYDFYQLTKDLIENQLKKDDPTYDGSSLVLEGIDEHTTIRNTTK